MGMLPYGGASHETAWQALCRVSTREAAGAPLRVDSSAWEIRCGERFLCRAPPGGDAVEVRFNSDLDWYLRFASRFHDALAGRG